MVESTNGPGGAEGPKYNPQYKVSPEFHKFWEKLFSTPVSDSDASKLTDTFIRNVWNAMDHVLKHALQAMKDLEQKRKEDGG
jgi:protein gp37